MRSGSAMRTENKAEGVRADCAVGALGAVGGLAGREKRREVARVQRMGLEVQRMLESIGGLIGEGIGKGRKATDEPRWDPDEDKESPQETPRVVFTSYIWVYLGTSSSLSALVSMLWRG